jgi:hypothetical protein
MHTNTPRLLALAIALATLPTPAWGATQAAPKAVTVAQDGSARLAAHPDGDELCLTLSFGAAIGEPTCRDVGRGGLATVARDARGAPTAVYVGAAVPVAAITVEVRRAGVLVATTPTVAGEAYRDAGAGSVRFALVRLPRTVPMDGLRIRALDGSGAVLEALAASDTNAELVSDRVPLLSGRSSGTHWRVSGERSSSLTPTVLDLEHETVSQCVRVRADARHDAGSLSNCTDGVAFDALLSDAATQVAAEDLCGASFRLLYGVVAGDTRAVSVLLGDGRRVAARLVPFAGGARVAYALVVPAAAAMRSVRLRPRAGVSRTIAVAAPPLRVACATNTGAGVLAGGPAQADLLAHPPAIAPIGPVTTVAGPPPYRIADGPGGSLCVALGDQPFTPLGCRLVSPNLADLSGVADDVERPRAFVLALPASVATVRISAADGAPRDIATVAGEGYAGPYAGHVRFAAATVSDARELDRLDLLDGAGRLLHREATDGPTVEPASARVSPPRRLAGRPGRPSLWQTPSRLGAGTARCLALTAGPPPASSGECDNPRIAGLTAVLGTPCTSHRLTIALAAPAGTRVIARLGGGRAVGVPLRRGAGLLTLPSSRGLRGLSVVRHGRTRRVRIDAPAGARQCGWQIAAVASDLP